MDFRSDNVAPAHPLILEALAAESRGSASAYGEDQVTQRLTEQLSRLFEHEVAIALVATGTAANALALALYTPPWGAVYCHPQAHIQIAECGAPEMFSGGAKLVSVPARTDHGKLTAEEVEATIVFERSPRSVRPAAISLSQASELGTVYEPHEIRELSAVARRQQLALHMDGARFANALVALGVTPAELTWKAGVNVLSLGVTKNGGLNAEAVVVFDRALAEQLSLRQKRAGHLLSKMRFAAVQLEAYLSDELWLHNARQANVSAARLARGFATLGIARRVPVQTNQVFCDLSTELAARLRARGFLFHDWPALGAQARRFVTSFCTSDAEIDALVHAAGA